MAKRAEFTAEQKAEFVNSYLRAYKSLQKRGMELDETTVGKYCHIQNLYAAYYSRKEITKEAMIQGIIDTFEGKKTTITDESIV